MKSEEETTLRRIRDGIYSLVRGLTPFVEARMKARYGADWLHYASPARGGPAGAALDEYGLLKTMLDKWREVFSETFDRNDKHEVLTFTSTAFRARNRAYHPQPPIKDNEALRFLDAMHQLLAAVKAAPEDVAELQRLYDEQRHLRGGDPAGSGGVFNGTINEFLRSFGDSLFTNLVQRKTKPYKNGVCEGIGRPQHPADRLEAAHIHGRERRKIIEEVLSRHENGEGIVHCKIDSIVDEIWNAHLPIANTFKFLCPECHREYDRGNGTRTPMKPDTYNPNAGTIGWLCVKLLAQRLPDELILAEVKKQFPAAKTGHNSLAWYRVKLRRMPEDQITRILQDE